MNKFYLLNNEDATVSLVVQSGSIPNANSYVTVSEADEYIGQYYREGNKLREIWEGLDEDDKEILLVSACLEIEALPFPGRKTESNQPLAFPRCPNKEVPLGVKMAQIELALWLSNDDEGFNQRLELQMQGVKSYSIGDLSETYGGYNSIVFYCNKAYSLLQKYLGGGFCVR